MTLTPRTSFSLFRGGGGADLGAESAGWRSIGGVEIDAKIAAVCDKNFPDAPTVVSDICAVDPLLLPHRPAHLHASPSCKNASQANIGAGETDEDRACGRAVERFLEAWLPEAFTLENVWQYRTFDAFNGICERLRSLGYAFDYWHLCSADYGVPQTRRRLILVARRGATRVQRPMPTHREGGDLFTPPWVGWYAAIADIIDTLPASRFAPWQEARLSELAPHGLTTSALVPCRSLETNLCLPDMPSYTVLADRKTTPRAFLIDGYGNTSRLPTVLDGDTPAMTVQAWHGRRPSCAPRAWLARGRVVKATVQALGRWQSFPDGYQGLTTEIVGNAVPPLLMRRIMEAL